MCIVYSSNDEHFPFREKVTKFVFELDCQDPTYMQNKLLLIYLDGFYTPFQKHLPCE